MQRFFQSSQGTLRGLHYQSPPYTEAKLVRCTRGRIFDVAVDLRPGSPYFRSWTAHELSEDNYHGLYVPEGCAHGFLTLRDDSEVFYQISCAYHPESSRGVRWDDPLLAIAWPEPRSSFRSETVNSHCLKKLRSAVSDLLVVVPTRNRAALAVKAISSRAPWSPVRGSSARVGQFLGSWRGGRARRILRPCPSETVRYVRPPVLAHGRSLGLGNHQALAD